MLDIIFQIEIALPRVPDRECLTESTRQRVPNKEPQTRAPGRERKRDSKRQKATDREKESVSQRVPDKEPKTNNAQHIAYQTESARPRTTNRKCQTENAR